MPDVKIVLFNALWVLGLSVILATWSYARYAAYQARVKTRVKLHELKYVLAMDLGLLLFVGGMAATESRTPARLLWVFIGIIIIAHAVLQIVAARGANQES